MAQKLVCELLEVNKIITLSSTVQWYDRHRTLIDMTAVYTNPNQTDWDKHLPMFTAAYRSFIHEKTGYTPNLLTLGRELVLGATERPKGCTGESQ